MAALCSTGRAQTSCDTNAVLDRLLQSMHVRFSRSGQQCSPVKPHDFTLCAPQNRVKPHNARARTARRILGDCDIPHPSEEIWRSSTLLAAPTNTFSRLVIESSEEMVKSFVNDWALSQELFHN